LSRNSQKAKKKAPLSGKSFCLSGKLSKARGKISAMIINAGGEVKSSISKKLDVLVAGDDPGSKLSLAKAYGIEIWDEDELNEAIEGGGISSDEEIKVYKKKLTKKKKTPPCSDVVWEWEDDEGEWNKFSKEDRLLLEENYQSGVKNFVTKDFSWNKDHGTLYKIDFHNLLQINLDSDSERAIRRCGAPKSKKAKKAKKATPMVVEADIPEDGAKHSWQWMDDEGDWQYFALEDSELVEKRYRMTKGKGMFSTTDFSFNKAHNSVYVVNFKKMSQRNVETGASRTIRRVSGPHPDDDDDDDDDEDVASSSTATKAEKKKKEKAGKIEWQWWMDDSKWGKFDKDDSKLLEEAYQSNASPFVTRDLSFNKIHQSLYIFDFLVMTQVNSDSGTSRKIRRLGGSKGTKGGHDKAEDDGYTSVLKSADWEAPIEVKASSKAPTFHPSISVKDVVKQQKLGPQSLRGAGKGKAKPDYGPIVQKDKHGRKCFDEMLANEKTFCGEWAVFYHSYSAAALMYEVQAAVAACLFRFKSDYATLPRLLWKPFNDIPDAKAMLKEFPTWPDRDHNPRFRAVGLCGTSSLLAHDSEAPPKSVFLMGYSVGPLTGILERLLAACGVPKKQVNALAKKMIKLAEKYGLDARGHGGKMCKSGRAGHLLQIFVRRELIDKYVYPAFPYGVPDNKRNPLGEYLSRGGQKSGQVRITVNPDVFLRASCVRMFVYSADPTFHANRCKFQAKLRDLLDDILDSDNSRAKAAKGIFGGKLPSWWSSEDQTDASKMSKKRYLMPDFS